jgi:hypothetical protein
MISGFWCEVEENYSILGYYTVSSGNSILTIWDNLLISTPRTKRLSQNIGKELPLLAA